jgi:acyl-CoA thioesterase YciA
MTDTRNISIRRLLLPKDTNHRGEIFGGALLAEIDLAGAIEARRHTLHDVATISFKEVVFKHPVQVGDVVTFYTSLIKIGTSSIHVRVEVESSRDGESAPISVTAAEVVYVTISRNQSGTITKVPVV